MASATVSLIVNANMFDTISLTGTHSGDTSDPWSKQNILNLTAYKTYDSGNAFDLSFDVTNGEKDPDYPYGGRYNNYNVSATYTWSFGDADVGDWRDRRDDRDYKDYKDHFKSCGGSGKFAKMACDNE